MLLEELKKYKEAENKFCEEHIDYANVEDNCEGCPMLNDRHECQGIFNNGFSAGLEIIDFQIAMEIIGYKE